MTSNDWFGSAVGLVGLIVVAFTDWRIALGVMLMMWGNNMQWGRDRNRTKENR